MVEKTEQETKRSKISPKKIETVKKLVSLIKDSNTIIIASIKGLPSRQLQDIKKKLRGMSDVFVLKKRIMIKAIEDSQKSNLEGLKNCICEDSAVLFSKQDAFELASFLAGNKNPVGAKSGQEAIEDIWVEEGVTDIMPGPAISEFGSLGIKVSVEEGKIAIKERKVIVKKGDKVTDAAASIMSKLDIRPFTIGLNPIVLCDINTGKLYKDVKIDEEKIIEELKTSAAKSLGFAQKIVYYCAETIGYLLAKANAEAKSLEKLSPVEKAPETPENIQQLNNSEEK